MIQDMAGQMTRRYLDLETMRRFFVSYLPAPQPKWRLWTGNAKIRLQCSSEREIGEREVSP